MLLSIILHHNNLPHNVSHMLPVIGAHYSASTPIPHILKYSAVANEQPVSFLWHTPTQIAVNKTLIIMSLLFLPCFASLRASIKFALSNTQYYIHSDRIANLIVILSTCRNRSVITFVIIPMPPVAVPHCSPLSLSITSNIVIETVIYLAMENRNFPINLCHKKDPSSPWSS